VIDLPLLTENTATGAGVIESAGQVSLIPAGTVIDHNTVGVANSHRIMINHELVILIVMSNRCEQP